MPRTAYLIGTMNSGSTFGAVHGYKAHKKDSSTYYAVLSHQATATHEIRKSVDGGATWSSVTTYAASTLYAVTYETEQLGQSIYICYLDGSDILTLRKFDMSTETFAGTYSSGVGVGSLTAGVHMALKSDGTVVFVGTTPATLPAYITCSSSGTWGALTTISSSAMYPTTVVYTSTGDFHIILVKSTPTHSIYRSTNGGTPVAAAFGVAMGGLVGSITSNAITCDFYSSFGGNPERVTWMDYSNNFLFSYQASTGEAWSWGFTLPSGSYAGPLHEWLTSDGTTFDMLAWPSTTQKDQIHRVRCTEVNPFSLDQSISNYYTHSVDIDNIMGNLVSGDLIVTFRVGQNVYILRGDAGPTSGSRYYAL